MSVIELAPRHTQVMAALFARFTECGSPPTPSRVLRFRPFGRTCCAVQSAAQWAAPPQPPLPAIRIRASSHLFSRMPPFAVWCLGFACRPALKLVCRSGCAAVCSRAVRPHRSPLGDDRRAPRLCPCGAPGVVSRAAATVGFSAFLLPSSVGS